MHVILTHEDATPQSRFHAQKGKLKGPLGGIQLLDREKIVATVLETFAATERRSPSLAGGIRAKVVLELFKKQEPELERAGLFQPLLNIEMPLARVLSSMECTGICLDRRVYKLSKQPLLRRQEEVS